MERLGLAIWQNRISPLFDVARRLFWIDIDNGMQKGNGEHLLFSQHIAGKISKICEFRIDTLICGAISKELSLLLSTHGILVMPFIAGNKDQVLAAYLECGLVPPTYHMPGCHTGKESGSGTTVKNYKQSHKPISLRNERSRL